MTVLVIWRSGERLPRAGLHRLRIGADLFRGVGVFLLVLVAHQLVWRSLAFAVDRGTLAMLATTFGILPICFLTDFVLDMDLGPVMVHAAEPASKPIRRLAAHE